MRANQWSPGILTDGWRGAHSLPRLAGLEVLWSFRNSLGWQHPRMHRKVHRQGCCAQRGTTGRS